MSATKKSLLGKSASKSAKTATTRSAKAPATGKVASNKMTTASMVVGKANLKVGVTRF